MVNIICLKKSSVIAISLVILFGHSLVKAQDNKEHPDQFIGKSIDIRSEEDSLFNKSYVELKNMFINNRSDNFLSKLYANGYLKKAKANKDTIEIANGYNLIWKICAEQEKLKYIDSIIFLTKDLNNSIYPAKGYILKGSQFFSIEKYDEALTYYLEAENIAKSRNNIRQLTTVKHNIGILKKAVGGKREAIHIFKENLKFIQNQDTIQEYLKGYISTLFAISDSYHRMELADSAKNYVKKGLIKSYNHPEKYKYSSFLLLSGINDNLLGNYEKALDTLYKTEKLIQKSGRYTANESVCYFQISRALFKTGEKEKAVLYLKKIDSIVTEANYTPEKRQGFEQLIKHYQTIGDKDSQLRVMSKLITMDSLFNEQNRTLTSDIVRKYETANLIQERDKIIDELEEDKKGSYKGFAILGFIILGLVIVVFNYYRKQKIYKARFEKLIANNKKEINNIKKTSVSGEAEKEFEIGIPPEIINDILEKLILFEKDLEFTKKDLSMNKVAKKLKTNSTYFSKVINFHKQKNFTNYINDLRIKHCMNRLQSDSKFRKYSVKSISEEVGFSSVQSFSRAFHKKTGIYPSYFIKELENRLKN